MLAGSTCLMNKDMIKLTSYKKADSYGKQSPVLRMPHENWIYHVKLLNFEPFWNE